MRQSHIFRSVLVSILFSTILLFVSCKEKEPIIITDPGPALKNTLILTKTAGYRHSSIEAGMEMFRQYALGWQLNPTYAGNTEAFTGSGLAPYSLIVLLNTTGDLFDKTAQQALQAYIRNGGRLLAIHAATDAEYDWPWYGEMLGAWFSNHPEIQEATCKINLPQHMAAAGLPAEWQRTDEWYNFKELKADNETVISIDEQTYTGGVHGNNHPISWGRTFEGGKIFYTAMGHTENTYSEPLFIQHIGGAIAWLMAD